MKAPAFPSACLGTTLAHSLPTSFTPRVPLGPCPVCNQRSSGEVYAAHSQPALLNQPCATSTEARSLACASLAFRACGCCGFAWNAAFDAERAHYAPGYVNDQTHSAAFSSHVHWVLERLAQALAGRTGGIVEVGCGQGAFLRALCARTARRGVGFDPAYRECGNSASADVRVRIRTEIFTERSMTSARHALGDIAMVVCRHVLEHLPDPLAMLRRMLAPAEPPGRSASPEPALLYVEVPDFEWIVRHAAFYDLYHEHCSLFSAASMRRALAAAGAGPAEITGVFDQQYLAVLCGLNHAREDHLHQRHDAQPVETHDVERTLRIERVGWARRLDALRVSRRPVLVWGAGAKGVSFVNQADPSGTCVQALVDVNPAKQGKFVPGSAHRVVSPGDARAIVHTHGHAACIIVMNPAYAGEVARQCATLHMHAEIIPVTEGAAVEVHG